MNRLTGVGASPWFILSTGICGLTQSRDLRDCGIILRLDLIPSTQV